MMNIKDVNIEDLKEWAFKHKLEPYRTNQILFWLYKKPVTKFSEMTTLSKDLRKKLESSFELWSLKETEVLTSSDGTKKWLFLTKDGDFVESVLIPDRDRETLCISTQIGCRMGCKFCLTGSQGFKRNLKKSEIIDQILWIKARGFRITNIVIMGMGEPLDNYEETVKALETITDEKLIGISYRKVTLSTVGLLPQLEKLLKEGPRCGISVSVNAPNPEKRAIIMPVEKRHPIKDIISLLKKYQGKTRKMFTIEYVLLKDFNDTKEDAIELSKLLSGLRCKINLIPFNPWEGAPFEKPSEEKIFSFQNILINRGFSVFIRKSRGSDILAACGQLRWKYAPTTF